MAKLELRWDLKLCLALATSRDSGMPRWVGVCQPQPPSSHPSPPGERVLRWALLPGPGTAEHSWLRLTAAGEARARKLYSSNTCSPSDFHPFALCDVTWVVLWFYTGWIRLFVWQSGHPAALGKDSARAWLQSRWSAAFSPPPPAPSPLPQPLPRMYRPEDQFGDYIFCQVPPGLFLCSFLCILPSLSSRPPLFIHLTSLYFNISLSPLSVTSTHSSSYTSNTRAQALSFSAEESRKQPAIFTSPGWCSSACGYHCGPDFGVQIPKHFVKWKEHFESAFPLT